jgi:hypothetical protein
MSAHPTPPRLAHHFSTGRTGSDPVVARYVTGGEQIDTMIITDHLYLHGLGEMVFGISVGKDASGKDVVTATRAG